jgi:predicted transcriptional regulator
MSVRDVALRYGEPHALALTTVQTVMERLRKKGFLQRAKERGVFLYSPRIAPSEAVRSLIHSFVSKTLEGSISPFVAYLSEKRPVSREEIAELRRLVEELEEREGRP